MLLVTWWRRNHQGVVSVFPVFVPLTLATGVGKFKDKAIVFWKRTVSPDSPRFDIEPVTQIFDFCVF